jgi:septin 4
VFGASNVELVTKTRTEHLTETDKVKARAPKTPLQSFLGIAEVEEKQTACSETNNVSVLYEFCTPWDQYDVPL